MRAQSSTHSPVTSRSRAVFADPFDPVRRGHAARPGQRGAVLTRRERQSREQAARLERVAADRRVREAVDWLVGHGANETLAGGNATASPVGWPMALNGTGQVIDSIVRLGMFYEPALTTSIRLLGAEDATARAERSESRRAAMRTRSFASAAEAPARAAIRRVIEPAMRPVGARANANATTMSASVSPSESVSVSAGPAELDASEIASSGPPPRAEASELEAASVNVTTASILGDAPVSLGARTVAAWVRQGCGAIVQLGRLARDAGWSIGQAAASMFILPRCAVLVDRNGGIRSLREHLASNESVVELRLDSGARAGHRAVALVVPAVSPTQQTVVSTGSPLQRLPKDRMTRHVPDPGFAGFLNVPRGSQTLVIDAFVDLAEKLDEVLMAPRRTAVGTALEQEGRILSEKWGAVVGTTLCDLAYSLTPPGAVFGFTGYAVSLTRKLARGQRPELGDLLQMRLLILHRPGPDGTVAVGHNPAVWTQGAMRHFEFTAPGHGVLYAGPRAARGTAAGSGLPVQRSPLGWRISGIPESYRAPVEIREEEWADLPDQMIRISPRSG